MADKPFHIIEASPIHIQPLADMWQAIDACAPERPFGGDTSEKVVRAKELISQAIQSHHAVVLVALSEQAIIGTISGHIYQRHGVKLGMVGVVYSLWVDEDQRRQGLGQTLVDAIEQKLEALGAQALQVGWDTMNHYAANWWQQRGYEPYEVIASKNLRG